VNVEVLDADERELEARIEGASVGFMNALRRTLMMEVPTLAIEDVTIYDNKSALFDEVVAHRLGMLPIPTDPNLSSGWDPDAEPDEGEDEAEAEAEQAPADDSRQVLYTLTYEGPGTVRARDLQPASGDEALEVADPEVPIVKLGQDQRLMLEATATLGRGRDHAKWQPVVAAGYRRLPTVEVTGPLGLGTDEARELASKAPEDAIELDGDEVVEIHDEVEAHDFLYNVGTAFDVDNVEFGQRDDVFRFQFETDGSLSAKQALREAVGLLMDQLDDVHAKAEDLQ
jgi:DNA-directed RNA polymerase subunit D